MSNSFDFEEGVSGIREEGTIKTSLNYEELDGFVQDSVQT